MGELKEMKMEKACNEGLMPLFGDLDILWFVRISRLNWIGHDSRRDSERKGSQVVIQKSIKRMANKTDDGIMYRQILRNAKLQIGMRLKQ